MRSPLKPFQPSLRGRCYVADYPPTVETPHHHFVTLNRNHLERLLDTAFFSGRTDAAGLF
jgi:hypothetical protein